jgi:hypothetical protein
MAQVMEAALGQTRLYQHFLKLPIQITGIDIRANG